MHLRHFSQNSSAALNMKLKGIFKFIASRKSNCRVAFVLVVAERESGVEGHARLRKAAMKRGICGVSNSLRAIDNNHHHSGTLR